jgi:hypothetical protein
MATTKNWRRIAILVRNDFLSGCIELGSSVILGGHGDQPTKCHTKDFRLSQSQCYPNDNRDDDLSNTIFPNANMRNDGATHVASQQDRA